MALRMPLIFAALLGFYALFAGQVSTTEAIAGIFLAIVMTTYAALLRHVRHRDLNLAGAPWVRLIVRPAASLLPDAVRVGRVLLRCLWRRPAGPVGVVSRQPFRSGSNDPGDAGRRGLVTLGISLAPNGYALELAACDDAVVLHRLAGAAPTADREWPLS